MASSIRIFSTELKYILLKFGVKPSISLKSKTQNVKNVERILTSVETNGALSLLSHHRRNGEPLVSVGVGFDRSPIERTHQG